ncbi:PAS domain S-box [Desulfocapsa sulfexigens DSM 10523]|uniref:PAS domain S-box n=1 Tax=Desulfocapsa sulfexigens (strain DSM 10523 / SB164P1) TaxID=1167006 RepID=M1P8H2_DESSD|nr:DUF3365 domain-containing protein [Desulfocapsa sulfexigens]AGF77952.1 PAS domain S-box [Desulfocapsa sulfexigens DSM 10523]
MKKKQGSNKHKISLSICLNLSIAVVMILVSIFIFMIDKAHMKKQALIEAQEKAKIILDRNLATHTFFAKQLKPAVFKLSDPYRPEDYFEPSWMSSTYAVREIDKYFKLLGSKDFYYKECAINARSPENEADAFERSFLQDLNTDPLLKERTLIREVDGQYYFMILKRGEVMVQSCLRCHTIPENAPKGLSDMYGPERSFGRKVDDVVSAISIKIPLSKAYANADKYSRKTLIVLALSFCFLMVVQFLIFRFFMVEPLSRIRKKAIQIIENDEHLGEEVPVPFTHDLGEMATAFNQMSKKLRRHVDNLEQIVTERTSELNASNEQYKSLFNGMINGFALHEIIFDNNNRPIDYKFLAVNPAFERITGLKAKDVIGGTVLGILPGTEKSWIDKYGKVVLSGDSVCFENYSVELDKYFYISAYRPAKNHFACIFEDITEKKKVEIEREKLVVALQKSLDEIKTLRGIIPICSTCHKIRNDEGFWQQVDQYISEHSKAVFSHGMCMECSDKLYSGQDWYDEGKKDGTIEE